MRNIKDKLVKNGISAETIANAINVYKGKRHTLGDYSANLIDVSSIYSGTAIVGEFEYLIDKLPTAVRNELSANDCNVSNDTIWLCYADLIFDKDHTYIVSESADVVIVLPNFESKSNVDALLNLQKRRLECDNLWKGMQYNDADFISDMYFSAVDCGKGFVFVISDFNKDFGFIHPSDLRLKDDLPTLVCTDIEDYQKQYSYADMETYGWFVQYLTSTLDADTTTPSDIISIAYDMFVAFSKFVASDTGRSFIVSLTELESHDYYVPRNLFFYTANELRALNENEKFYIGDSRDIIYLFAKHIYKNRHRW